MRVDCIHKSLYFQDRSDSLEVSQQSTSTKNHNVCFCGEMRKAMYIFVQKGGKQ